MPINRQAIREAVAVRHGVILSEDDPILAFLAVHETVLDLYAKQFEEAGQKVLSAWQAQARKDVQAFLRVNEKSQKELSDLFRLVVVEEAAALRKQANTLTRIGQQMKKHQALLHRLSLVLIGSAILNVVGALAMVFAG